MTFFHFLYRKRVIHRKYKKGVCSNEPIGRTVQPTHLILISIEVEFCTLQNYIVFFSNFILVLELHVFF